MLISMPDLMLLAEGREAEVFLRSDGSVLKLLRESTYGPRAEREAAALRILNADGYSAPKLLELVTVNGRRGIVTERIDGENLLVLLGHHLFRSFELVERSVVHMPKCTRFKHRAISPIFTMTSDGESTLHLISPTICGTLH